MEKPNDKRFEIAHRAPRSRGMKRIGPVYNTIQQRKDLAGPETYNDVRDDSKARPLRFINAVQKKHSPLFVCEMWHFF